MPKLKVNNREEWLNEALRLLTPNFKEIGQTVPKKIRVSCGFPSRNGLGGRKQRIGECWADKASLGSYFEIFISPVLSLPVGKGDKCGVLDTLTHEIIHAIVGIEAGHKQPFKVVATKMGLEGKMTATKAGAELTQRLYALSKELGPYPHDQITNMTNLKKKDVCRLVKAECPGCGYIIRTTRKWIAEAGLPTCVCGEQFTSEIGEAEDGE